MPFGFAVPSPASDDPASYWKTPLQDPNAVGAAVDPASVTLPTLSVTAPQPQAGAGPASAPAAAGGQMTDQQALIASAQRLGLSPVEWGGIIHYESGGDPSRWGGAKNADGSPRHVGLIQFGPAEQKQFGVTGKESFQEQLPKAEAFLLSRKYQPGSGVMNAYSTINAGSPGRFNASDAGNGGMPGTVADKVNSQFAPHYAWANKFLGGGMQLPSSAGGSAQPAGFGLKGPTQGAAPFSMAAPGGGATMGLPNDAAAASADASGLDPMKLMQAITGGQGGQGGGGAGGGGGSGGGGGQQAGGPSFRVQAPRPRPFSIMKFNMFGGR
jgi:hypothetical protein